MKWNFTIFITGSIAILVVLGAIGFFTQKNDFYKPTLEKYTADTDRLKEICQKLLEESDPAEMNRVAMSLQLSKAVSCNEYNGECRAYFDFLAEALKVSSNNQFMSGHLLILRDKYENLIRAIEDGKIKLKK